MGGMERRLGRRTEREEGRNLGQTGARRD